MDKEKQHYSKFISKYLASILLPYNQNVTLRCEPDFYGASRLISEQLGMKNTPRSFSSWSHGVCYFDLKYPEQVIWDKSWKKSRLIANDQVKFFLTGFKFKRVKAIGLPIVYVPSHNVIRREKSVLVMLAHSLPYCEVDHDLSGLLNLCKKLKNKGCYVCICVHKDCFIKGKVTSELDQNNIDWFVGASANDVNSLKRMRNIFEHFETVASNAIGSHFYYAQLFGAKFFFIDPFFEYKPELLKNDPNYKDKAELLEHNLKEASKSVIKRKFPNYFCEHKDAICDQDLAEKECGTSHKLEPLELAQLLGWSLKGQLLLPFLYYGSKLAKMVNINYFRR